MQKDSLIGQYIGQYKILSKIGRGGMAEVYQGLHETLQRHVAIKLVGRHLQSDPAVTERFLREARAVATLRHPNIVQIYDFGRYEGGHYMVMEYVDGTDLRSEIDRRFKAGEEFTPEEVVDIAAQIAAALDYAHSEGVIHRDVKPGNVLLNTKGDVILGDFGLAMLRNRVSQATLGHTFGTPEYIAPEQALDSRAATPQSDIYALGGILYEMVTGKLPFDAETSLSLALKHVSEAPVPLRTHAPHIPVGVEEVILKALEKEPAQRYQTGAELVEALKTAWQTEGVDETWIVGPSATEAEAADETPVKRRMPSSPSAYESDAESSEERGPRGWIWGGALLAVLVIALLARFVAGVPVPGLGAPPTLTSTATPTLTATLTATPSPSLTPTATQESPLSGGGTVTATVTATMTATPSPSPTATPTSTPTPTPTPTSMPTETPSPTPTPTLAPGATLRRDVDGMTLHFVPGGSFLMGAPESDPEAADDEQPQHEVVLSPFWMDETEVTTAQYKQCVAEGACEAPYTRTTYDNPTYADRPMTYISWEQAVDYCTWVGEESGWEAQLPTEAQWEKAASWDPLTETKRRYPWGDVFDEERVQLGVTTAAVGSYPDGASAYGILDMAGNVREWVFDWYDADTYEREPRPVDPNGPASGIYKVMRGGSYGSVANFRRQLRTTHREVGYPESTAERPAKSAELGFRCVVVGERLP